MAERQPLVDDGQQLEDRGAAILRHLHRNAQVKCSASISVPPDKEQDGRTSAGDLVTDRRWAWSCTDRFAERFFDEDRSGRPWTGGSRDREVIHPPAGDRIMAGRPKGDPRQFCAGHPWSRQDVACQATGGASVELSTKRGKRCHKGSARFAAQRRASATAARTPGPATPASPSRPATRVASASCSERAWRRSPAPRPTPRAAPGRCAPDASNGARLGVRPRRAGRRAHRARHRRRRQGRRGSVSRSACALSLRIQKRLSSGWSAYRWWCRRRTRRLGLRLDATPARVYIGAARCRRPCDDRVTGGAGFIGSNLHAALARRGVGNHRRSIVSAIGKMAQSRASSALAHRSLPEALDDFLAQLPPAAGDGVPPGRHHLPPPQSTAICCGPPMSSSRCGSGSGAPARGALRLRLVGGHLRRRQRRLRR